MFKNLIFFLLAAPTALCFITNYRISPRAGCTISITNLDPEPVVVSTKTNTFIYPEPNESTISLSANEAVTVACPGGYISAGGSKLATTVEATCVSGSTFKINNKSVDFKTITCSRNPFHTARYTGKSCEAGGKEIEVGFDLGSQFVRDILICFDQSNLISLYSTYDLTKSIGSHESGVARPSFIEDDFYNLDIKVNNLYVRGGQRSTINSLLGLSDSSTKYIQDSSDYYLSRGHLTAKADFVYGPQQLSTFHYVNAAPQWQTFNGANWETAESDVRDYADTNELDLKVYTGTYGVTTLPHEKTGEEIPLYLYADNGMFGIPVPELYWKVVYDPATKRGIALLGLNNPYQEDVSKSIICKDISSSVKWLNWDADNLKFGYSYACTVDDLRKSVSYLPEFEVNDVLL